MKLELKWRRIIGGVVTAALAVGGVHAVAGPDRVLVGNIDHTITESGTPIDYFEVTCVGAVRSIRVRGSYVRLHDCEVTGSVTHAIRIGTYPTATDVHDVIIEKVTVRNSVTENGVYPACGTIGSGGWGSGIKAEKGSHDLYIHDNDVHENCGEGIAATMADHVRIENNLTWNNWAGNIYADASSHVSIVGNIVICDSNTSNGYISGRQTFGIMDGHEYYSGWTGGRSDLEILNNVVQGCYDGISIFKPEAGAVNHLLANAVISGNTVTLGWRWSIIVSSGAVVQNVTITNNRLHRTAFSAVPGVAISNNTIFNQPAITPTGIAPIVSVTLSLTGLPVTSTFTFTPPIPTATRTLTISPTAGTPPTTTVTRTPLSATPTQTPTRTPMPMTPTPTFECYLFPAHGQRVCLP